MTAETDRQYASANDSTLFTEKAEKVFILVAELSPEQRSRRVKELADGDTKLERFVFELIAADDATNSESFILNQGLFSDSDDKFTDLEQRFSFKSGDEIDRYKLEHRLGEGGMGVVFLAEQTSDIQRNVAVKIIKRGSNSKATARRFQNECQAMVRLDHPGIAKVLDAGTAESGHSYLVVELVQGMNIVNYAFDNRLSIGELLRLFCQVCTAVQHAHQKGIIHCDLKPSNILVSDVNGKPGIKIIDFGIARALDQSELHPAVGLLEGGMHGTPGYMSPEQEALDSSKIDSRSDIYSLGAVLHELLNGVPPSLDFNSDQSEMPIARLESVTWQRTTSRQSRRLNEQLNYIILKSLHRDPDDRYASVDRFSDDIERLLNGEPVDAVPPSLAYRLTTFVSKYRGIATLAAGGLAIFLAAAACCIFFGIQAISASASKDEALHKLKLNNRQLTAARDKIQAQSNERRFVLAARTATMITGSETMAESPLAMFRFRGPVDVISNAVIGFQDDELFREDLEKMENVMEVAQKQDHRFVNRTSEIVSRMRPPTLQPAELKTANRDYTNKSKSDLQMRSRFYRNLVGECEAEFDGKGEYLVSALILYSVSLNEQSQIDLATEQIKRAISISESDAQKQRCMKLLKMFEQVDQ